MKQRYIEKIIAVENVSFSDAIYLFKNHIVNKGQSFSKCTADSVPPTFSSQPTNIYSQSKFNSQLNALYFPPLSGDMEDSLVNGKNKNYRKKKRSSSSRLSHLYCCIPLYCFRLIMNFLLMLSQKGNLSLKILHLILPQYRFYLTLLLLFPVIYQLQLLNNKVISPLFYYPK